MNKGIITDIDWSYIGAVLANENDATQIKFLKSFVKECKSWGTEYQVQGQLSLINRGLSKEEIDCLGMITYEEE